MATGAHNTSRRAAARRDGSKTSAAAGVTGQVKLAPLPPITVARFEEALKMLERLAQENTGVFLENAGVYRERHREATRRPMNMQEAAGVAAALGEAVKEFGETPGDIITALQASDITAYDEPESSELLLAAGMATAPAFMAAARRLIALVELDPDVFRQARRSGTLDDVVGEAAEELTELEVAEARARGARALAAVRQATGFGLGEAGGLLARWAGQAMAQATTGQTTDFHSTWESLTGSPPNTGGPETSSSTSSPGSTP